MDETAKRNLTRVNLLLKPFVNNYSNIQKEEFKKYEIIYKGQLCSLEDIDFNNSVIFICDTDFLSYISYYGMIKVNDIRFPDLTQAGTYSIIRNTYMVVDSQDIRFSKIPTESFYNSDRDGSLPDSWNSINYIKKDIIMWRLVSNVGIGDDEKMYSGCSSWVTERYRNGKVDWLFFIGNLDSFKSKYSEIATLGIPIYKIALRKGQINTSSIITNDKVIDKSDIF